jgi:hypothetical protein
MAGAPDTPEPALPPSSWRPARRSSAGTPRVEVAAASAIGDQLGRLVGDGWRG